jgi:hypothetical protein
VDDLEPLPDGDELPEGVRMIDSLTAAAAILVAVAGVAKVRSPQAAVAMLRRGWPGLRRFARLPSAVRVGGAAETSVGLAVLAAGGRVGAALLAACYLAFAVVAGRLMRRGDNASCGCFGRSDSPVGRAHLGLNLVCVAVSVTAAVRSSRPVGGVLEHGVAIGSIAALQILLLAWLGFLSITALPALAAARRRVVESQ